MSPQLSFTSWGGREGDTAEGNKWEAKRELVPLMKMTDGIVGVVNTDENKSAPTDWGDWLDNSCQLSKNFQGRNFDQKQLGQFSSGNSLPPKARLDIAIHCMFCI